MSTPNCARPFKDPAQRDVPCCCLFFCLTNDTNPIHSNGLFSFEKWEIWAKNKHWLHDSFIHSWSMPRLLPLWNGRNGRLHVASPLPLSFESCFSTRSVQRQEKVKITYRDAIPRDTCISVPQAGERWPMQMITVLLPLWSWWDDLITMETLFTALKGAFLYL